MTEAPTHPDDRRLSSSWAPPHPVDPAQVLWPVRRGSHDPTLRFEPGGIWRTSLTPLGPVTLHLATDRRPEIRTSAWGPGAEWATAQVPELLGADLFAMFGIPSHALMALMIGAMMIQGITPGPRVVVEQPELFWGVIASMWIGNAMLIILNLPLVGLWVSLLRVPYTVLFPAIVAFSAIGVFTVRNEGFDVYILAFAGLVGYLLYKLDCEPAPFLLGFVLGDLLEEHFRRALVFSNGDPMVFLRHRSRWRCSSSPRSSSSS